MKSDLIRGASMIVTAAILATIIPACGSGGGSAGAAPQAAALAEHRIHASAVVASVMVPSSTTAILKQSIFTPATPNDLVHGFFASCQVTASIPGGMSFILDIKDDLGNVLVHHIPPVGVNGAGTNVPVYISAPIFIDKAGQTLNYPAPQYTVVFSCVTDATYAANVTNITLRALVSDNSQLIVGSPNWN